MSISTLLKINQLKLSVCLGWGEKERARSQTILVTFAINMPAPKASRTDQLKDTICYDTLIKQIQAHVKHKEYRLIEFLSQDLYTLIKSALPNKSRLEITILKKPKITGFDNTVSFTYGDQ